MNTYEKEKTGCRVYGKNVEYVGAFKGGMNEQLKKFKDGILYKALGRVGGNQHGMMKYPETDNFSLKRWGVRMAFWYPQTQGELSIREAPDRNEPFSGETATTGQELKRKLISNFSVCLLLSQQLPLSLQIQSEVRDPGLMQFKKVSPTLEKHGEWIWKDKWRISSCVKKLVLYWL